MFAAIGKQNNKYMYYVHVATSTVQPKYIACIAGNVSTTLRLSSTCTSLAGIPS